MKRSPLLSLVVVAALVTVIEPACSIGEGQGDVKGTLNVPDCWSGPFDLKPDFFAALPYRGTSLIIRVQRGGNFEAFSDGLSVLVDSIPDVRNTLGQPLSVSLPPGVTPPGVPIKANPNPASVHATLYLEGSCRTENVTLYALDSVTLNSDGTCVAADGGPEPPPDCSGATTPGGDGGPGAGDASADAAAPTGPAPVGHSTITFFNLFNGNRDETNAAERLTDAQFDLFLADPRDICPGGLGPPPRCRGEITGYFKFYFERGRPAQPFP